VCRTLAHFTDLHDTLRQAGAVYVTLEKTVFNTYRLSHCIVRFFACAASHATSTAGQSQHTHTHAQKSINFRSKP
jgi:hypothetical protein